MKRFGWMTLLALAGFSGTLQAATKGSCESAAAEVDIKGAGSSRTVTLTQEYDPDEGAYDQSGAGIYYFKATLKRQHAYTVWTDGLTTNDDISVTCYAADPKDDDSWGCSADFSEVEEMAGNQRFVMYADDWYIDEEDKSENDPKSWTFYFQVAGSLGDSVTISFAEGVNIPAGRTDNPRSISPQAAKITYSGLLQLDGEFDFRARLQAGRLYYFRTEGGTESKSLNMVISGEDSDDESGSAALDLYDDPATWEDEYNTGYYVVPSETAYYSIELDGGSENELQPFGLTYQMVPSRAISAHASVALNESNGYAAEFTPGYMSNTAKGYYDPIIDEALFSFSAEKGERILVQTEGAQTNLLLRVYDAKGNILQENRGDGETMNVRCGFVTTVKGVYYVGVCQALNDEFAEAPAGTTARIQVTRVTVVEGSPDAADPADDVAAGATGLSPVPGTASDKPEVLDASGSDWHELNSTDWADVFMIGARKGVTYSLRTSLQVPDSTANTLKAEVFTLGGTKEKIVATTGNVNAGSEQPLTFTASAHDTYYVRLSVAEGQGLNFPAYKVHASAFTTSGAALGILTVNALGTALATWSLDKESVKYPGGASILVSGTHDVRFTAVKGFTTPAAQTAVVAAGTVPTVVTAYYSDTSDPKDDTWKGAVAWTPKNVETTVERTLWAKDPEDNFSFSTKDGQYYDIALRNVTGDAVFSITNAVGDADHPDGVFAKDVKSVSQLVLPAAKTKYMLTVRHETSAAADGSYALAGYFANVGAIQFAKNAVTVKENAPTVSVTVNRTAKDGCVRVRYGTVAGTAQPGVDYVSQTGILEWPANDNKAKTIVIRLIPDLVAVYEGNKTFAVQLLPVEDEERAEDEYPASILGGGVCAITMTEVSKAGTTVESTYAAKAPKGATVKTEAVPLESGTFSGVLCEDGCALSNGLPKYASITLTASTATPPALSAKIQLAGKTYTFKDKGWDHEDETVCEKTFELAQKVGTVTYTNTLFVSVAHGATADKDAWQFGGGEVELTMNVPDANGKGAQEDIRYSGCIYRDNAKVQDYLTAVTNFTGYYTVALIPDTWVGSGVPAGNGYLTITLDNKGTAKVAGLLADGSTKVSLSAKACGIRADAESENGLALFIPVYLAKSPYCLGGELRLFKQDDGRIVVDSTRMLGWFNDNRALTYDNEDGYAIELTPVGGWYDQIINLQAYYLNYALEIGTADVSEFPTEVAAAGYTVSMDANPSGTPVAVEGDKISTAKRTLVKNGKLVDYLESLNVCNVQLKYARATGLVTGSFSVWSENEDGTVQKEISGIKHNGVLLLARDALAPLDDEILSAGFFTQALNVTDENPDTGKVTKRKWTFSAPFNVLGIDQGDIDWWADDWGEQP